MRAAAAVAAIDQEPADSETVPVQVVVLAIERISAGKLVALAAVELLIAGVEIVLQGVRIERTGPHTFCVGSPTFKGPGGVSYPAAILPLELAQALADAVLDEYKGFE